MKTLKNYFLIALLGAAVMAGCRSDDDAPCCDATNPECPNYDPCWDRHPTAEFKMRQTSPGFVIPDELQAEWCDTIARSAVEFLADMDNALSYTWQIGFESEPRSGRRLAINFSEYTNDTVQNLNPQNSNYYNPLPITLTVRNTSGACVAQSDTVLSNTRQLVFARKSLISGTFRGRVEGESFDRDIILWKDSTNQDIPDYNYWFRSLHIGLPYEDTLTYFTIWASSMQSRVRSYKQIRWDEDAQQWWIGTDGIQKWNQQITTSADGPDRVDLYYERYPENGSDLQTVKFSGERIE
ncbi:MAG: hypothetical protein ABR572_11540 [Cryomorphaceae bacterium]|nr:hypothetical protein [Flavobacteriales bacterium]